MIAACILIWLALGVIGEYNWNSKFKLSFGSERFNLAGYALGAVGGPMTLIASCFWKFERY